MNSHIIEKSKEHRESSSQGSTGEMSQFSAILKLIFLPLHIGKLRIGLRTWLFVDAQAFEPLWLYLVPSKRLVVS